MKIILGQLQSIISLICGIVVLVSMFISWFSATLLSGYGMKVTYSANAWGVIGGDLPFIGPVGPVFTLVGGILMIAFALAAMALSRFSADYDDIFDLLAKGARAVPLFVVFGVFFYMVDARSSGCGGLLPVDWISAGPWVALPFALIGIGAGITKPAATPPGSRMAVAYENPSGGTTAARSMRREMLERKFEEQKRPERSEGDAGLAKDHFNRASDYESRGQDEQAIAAYTQAIEADPGYALAYYYRGSLYALQEKNMEALQDFQKVTEVSEDSDLVSMAKKRIQKLNG